MNNTELELVISKFRENTNWIKQINQNVKITIYNKFDQQDIKLPNVGREAHTYLYHIINRYDTLSEFTCFLQGDPFPHETKIIEHINSFRSDKSTPIFFGPAIVESTNSFSCPHHINGLPVWYFVDLLFGINLPNKFKIHFNAGAQFILHRDIILSRPKDFYEFLIKFVSFDIKPVESYIFERLWPFIFDNRNQLTNKYLLWNTK